MRVMTFNLRCNFPLDFKNKWENRKDIIFHIINKYNCDIIGTQEVTNSMFEDISKNIKKFNIIGEPRSKRFFSERNDILISDRYKIKNYKTFWLSENPEKVGSSKWYSIFPRICTTAVLNIEDGKKIRVCNLHLDCFLPQAREYGLKKLIEFIEKEQEKEDIPVILMGDFNATPNSKLIRNLKNGKYCKKKFVAVQDFNKELYKMPTRSDFGRKRKGIHIDYIFVSEDIEIINTEIISDNINGKYPSDHFPVMAEIKIKN